jgi:hypothetical protein
VSDDVYIVNQSAKATVTLFDPGEARNITISDGNVLQVFFKPAPRRRQGQGDRRRQRAHD